MNFSDIIRLYNIPRAPEGHEHSRAGWVNMDCPDCTPNSRHWRLGYNLRGKYFSCWACGYRPLISTLISLTNQPYSVVKSLVDDLPSERAEVDTRRGKLVLPEGLGPLLPCHREYLKGRGYDVDHIERLWGLQGIGLASQLAWRVFIPYFHNGEVVSWLTRGITDTARHRSASPDQEVYDHKTLLYGEDHARQSVIVLEGATDVWAVGPGGVGLCGIGYKREQVLRLSRFAIRAVCFNTEVAAQKRARRLCRELSCFPGETHNVVLTYKDAAETMCRDPGELELLRKKFLL